MTQILFHTEVLASGTKLFSSGFYDGCDTSVISTQTIIFALDPAEIIENSTYPCWDLRDLPQVCSVI